MWDVTLLSVLFGAFQQSIVSTLLTLVLGFVGAVGLLGLKERVPAQSFHFCCIALVVPCFLPPIIVVLLSSSFLGWLPTGLFGVVLFHLITSNQRQLAH